MTNAPKKWIVSLSTFPPRPCGIATYAASLTAALDALHAPSCSQKVIAMHRSDVLHEAYPDEVLWTIEQAKQADYVATAEAMNADERVQLVHIQHEFGIFGGEFGSNLLLFTEACAKPMVITFHTVLPEPHLAMRDVVQRLSRDVSRVCVMTQLAKHLLVSTYGVDPAKIEVIPHGIPDMPYQTSAEAKRQLGFGARPLLLTFGLLSRGKGIEYVIEALPAVVEKHPDVLYVVAGMTHPAVKLHEGESYREELEKRVSELGLISNVLFHNEYLTSEELLGFLAAADMYIATSLDPNQSVSGTLSYALGSGRPVISTAFAQAKELVNNEVGILVDFRSPERYAAAALALLDNEDLRLRMGRKAYEQSRGSTWPNAALATMRAYEQCAPSLRDVDMALPPINLGHLEGMTDDFGLVQFADLHVPNMASGYTVDDNARALLAVTRYHELFGDDAVVPLAETYLGFLERAANPAEQFDNYYQQTRDPQHGACDSENYDDAQGRAFQALAYASVSPTLPEPLPRRARAMVQAYFASSFTFESPRSSAFFVDGLHALWLADRDPSHVERVRMHCQRLVDHFRDNRSDGWEWFEPCVTYANSSISEALLRGFEMTGNPEFLEVGRITLNFLISHTFRDGMYLSIGQRGWLPRDGARAYFDQQPEDAAAMVRTLTVLQRVAPSDAVLKLRQQAYQWFLGRNMLGHTVYLRTSGGCYDGIGENAVNLNQGAESTVSALLARLAMEDGIGEVGVPLTNIT